MANLLPCPFCGGDDIIVDFKHPIYAGNGREFSARCEDCGCEGPHSKDPSEGWNKRVNTMEGANLQTYNTGSPKLPCFEFVRKSLPIQWNIASRNYRDGAKDMYEFMCRQIQAGT